MVAHAPIAAVLPAVVRAPTAAARQAAVVPIAARQAAVAVQAAPTAAARAAVAVRTAEAAAHAAAVAAVRMAVRRVAVEAIVINLA